MIKDYVNIFFLCWVFSFCILGSITLTYIVLDGKSPIYYEPNPIILYSEFIMSILTPVFVLGLIYKYIRELTDRPFPSIELRNASTSIK